MRFVWDEKEQDYFSEEEIAEIKLRRWKKHAAQEGDQQEGNKREHKDRDRIGKTPETSSSDCIEQCKEIWEENP